MLWPIPGLTSWTGMLPLVGQKWTHPTFRCWFCLHILQWKDYATLFRLICNQSHFFPAGGQPPPGIGKSIRNVEMNTVSSFIEMTFHVWPSSCRVTLDGLRKSERFQTESHWNPRINSWPQPYSCQYSNNNLARSSFRMERVCEMLLALYFPNTQSIHRFWDVNRKGDKCGLWGNRREASPRIVSKSKNKQTSKQTR